MTAKEYNLDFKQAIDIILNGGAVRGNEFAAGIFLKLNSVGQMVIVDANSFYQESTGVSLKSLSQQKFRSLQIMTKKELSQ